MQTAAIVGIIWLIASVVFTIGWMRFQMIFNKLED